MAGRSWLSSLTWLAALVFLIGLLAAAYILNDWVRQERARQAADDRVDTPKRATNSIVKLGATLAESHGIQDEPAQGVVWYEHVTVFGRVVPNPQATSELRSPFAGTLRADPAALWPALGRWVSAGQVLARVEVRVGPQERLELQAKLTDARTKQEGAEDILRVRQERLDRLQKLVDPLIVSQKERDDALEAVAEARTQLAAARAAADLWQRAIDALQKRGDRSPGPWTETLTSAADGEVSELVGRPGTAVEAGGLIARLVDFRRALVRLELPPEVLASGPPPLVELVATPSASPPLGSAEPAEPPPAPAVTAKLVGPAGHVDAASQLAGYWYEVEALPSPKAGTSKEPGADGVGPGGLVWRPGLFVQARLKVSGAKPQQALSVARTALLFHQGRALVYVRIGPGRFERREVRLLGREGERWVVAAGLAAGEPVVCRQAQVLLSEEFRGDVDND